MVQRSVIYLVSLIHDLAKKVRQQARWFLPWWGLIAIIQSKSARRLDKLTKDIPEIFKAHGLRITAKINHQTVNFLNITNLSEEVYAPYMKPNNLFLYVHCNSNHPSTVIKQIPKSIDKPMLSLSANNFSFEPSATFYRDALKNSNYKSSYTYHM